MRWLLQYEAHPDTVELVGILGYKEKQSAAGGKRKKSSCANPEDEGSKIREWELTNIAVCRPGCGYGTMLLQKFQNEWNVGDICRTTVDNNRSAQAFWGKAQIQDGTRWVPDEKTLSSQENGQHSSDDSVSSVFGLRYRLIFDGTVGTNPSPNASQGRLPDP